MAFSISSTCSIRCAPGFRILKAKKKKTPLGVVPCEMGMWCGPTGRFESCVASTTFWTCKAVLLKVLITTVLPSCFQTKHVEHRLNRLACYILGICCCNFGYDVLLQYYTTMVYTVCFNMIQYINTVFAEIWTLFQNDCCCTCVTCVLAFQH